DEAVLPGAVAFPVSTEEVAAVLAWAEESRTPIVPRGGGSGVSGGATAMDGCVVVDLSRMDRILEVDAASAVVEVQAGVRGDVVDATLAFGRMGHSGGCLLIAGFPGDAPGVGDRLATTVLLGESTGGRNLGAAPGEHWWEHRNDAVDQYRRVMGPDRSFGPGT